jgi:surface protein
MVPGDTDLTALVATFTAVNAVVSVNSTEQVSGETANDFSSTVTYSLSADDGTNMDYIVTVVHNDFAEAEDLAEITSFGFLASNNSSLSSDVIGVFDGYDITLSIPYKSGLDLSALIPTFTATGPVYILEISEQESGVSEQQESGLSEQDFTSEEFLRSVSYLVATDNSCHIYTATVLIKPASKSELVEMVTATTSAPDNISARIINADTSEITDMSSLFDESDLQDTAFNQDISSWNVSKVTNMDHMFFYTTAFNQDISSWDVSSVIDMSCMFFGAEAFNQDISTWVVSKVTNMEGMFFYAEAFNQDISEWDVSNVTSYKDFDTGSPIEGTDKSPTFN